MFPLWRSSYTVLDPLFLEFREFFYATLQEPHAALTLTLTLTLRQEHSPYSFRFRWPFQAELCPLSGGRVRLIPISAALLGQCRRIFGSFLSLSSPPFGRPILGFFTHLGSLFRQHVNADCEFLALFRPIFDLLAVQAYVGKMGAFVALRSSPRIFYLRFFNPDLIFAIYR